MPKHVVLTVETDDHTEQTLSMEVRHVWRKRRSPNAIVSATHPDVKRGAPVFFLVPAAAIRRRP